MPRQTRASRIALTPHGVPRQAWRTVPSASSMTTPRAGVSRGLRLPYGRPTTRPDVPESSHTTRRTTSSKLQESVLRRLVLGHIRLVLHGHGDVLGQERPSHWLRESRVRLVSMMGIVRLSTTA